MFFFFFSQTAMDKKKKIAKKNTFIFYEGVFYNNQLTIT